MASDALSEIFADCSAVMFDFDGPICDVFAGMPADRIACSLASIVEAHDSTLGAKAHQTDDPIEVLRLSQQGGPALLKTVEEALIASEVAAVAIAGLPTAGAIESLRAAHESGRKVAVVSNNSGECVQKFLLLHGLADLVQEVVGRPEHHPELMKPSPHLLIKASRALNASPLRCLLIGDSVTDIQAARAAGTPAIGYANKPHKDQTLSEAGANAVITDMHSVATTLSQV